MCEYVNKGWAIEVPYPPKPEYVTQKMGEVLGEPKNFVPRNIEIHSWAMLLINCNDYIWEF